MVQAADISVQDVRNHDSKEFQALDDAKINHHIDRAVDLTNSVYSGQSSTLSVIEGSEAFFTELLAAHRATLSMGGDPTNEGATGGDASYSVVQGSSDDHLAQTRYGREAQNMLRDEQSISVVRSDR